MSQKLRALNHLHKGYWSNFPKGISRQRIFLKEVWPTHDTYTVQYIGGQSVTCTIMSNSDDIMASPSQSAMEHGWNWLRPVVLWPENIRPPQDTLAGHLRLECDVEIQPVFESKRSETWQKESLWLLERVSQIPLITVVLDINLTDKTAATTVEFDQRFFIQDYTKCEL